MKKESKALNALKGLIGFVVIIAVMSAALMYFIPIMQGKDERDTEKALTLMSDKYKEAKKTREIDVYPNFANSDKDFFQSQSLYIEPFYAVDSKYIYYNNANNTTYKTTFKGLENLTKEDDWYYTHWLPLGNVILKAYKIGSDITAEVNPKKFNWEISNGTMNTGYPWRVMTAFENAITLEEMDYANDAYQYNILQETGLKLKEENVVIDKIIAHDACYTFVFNADITTIEKPKKYKHVKWLPKEGESSNVTFSITLMTNTSDGTQVLDMDILKYNNPN